MIEAHYKMSILREKACAGVAEKKGLGAEGRLLRVAALATRITSVLLSTNWSECYLNCSSRMVDSRVCGCFLLIRELALAESTSLPYFFDYFLEAI